MPWFGISARSLANVWQKGRSRFFWYIYQVLGKSPSGKTLSMLSTHGMPLSIGELRVILALLANCFKRSAN
ncbi:MAG: hypothetical protein RMY64_18385 [Nostoc sp. DedQUE08]|uniref:hypothetical protein n=1 Tax=Nostoc sp. DedQUE08 TaxID=3075393 RepID=UPI002AD4AEB7|nr:hypothetical protein [Nostoc sp. DedQUE08]MDZ8067562.1 hypothetical protein [Nostoc sp. DedQUE08]